MKKIKKTTQQDVADAWGMTQANVSKMVAQGMPLDSVEAACAWRKQFLARKALPKELEEARTRKVLLECERLEMQLEKLRSDYVSVAEVRKDDLLIGRLLATKLEAFVNESPKLLAGLEATEVQQRVFNWTQRYIKELKEELSQCE